ncbi:hypothetical protein NEOLI_003074 [Neolecta irregularis DAH-3]|uniref:Flap endonuclease 1 n=1 Tax=Neolecta irregularis (strain DAH-3) TaxID=1198029 RepID=A0A1U7LJB5_NEOID|nr:hypothetical protein NEOLI_003074 [Neolecta irregularis DAH-3]|eukprot:OLL22718.1 hypothetical protein NEOLI_003074 [Neolecta irregularis DAH-3]
MGVSGLVPFLTKTVPETVKKVLLEDLKNFTIAIDGTLFIRKFYASPRYTVNHPKKALAFAFHLARACRQMNIFPVVLFDGKDCTPAKLKERARRKLIFEQHLVRVSEEKARNSRLTNLKTLLKKVGKLPAEEQKKIILAAKPLLETSAVPKPGLVVTGKETIKPKEKPVKLDSSTQALANKFTKLVADVLSRHDTLSKNEVTLVRTIVAQDGEVVISKMVENTYYLEEETQKTLVNFQRRVEKPKGADLKIAKKALSALGISVITTNLFEAECHAAALVKNGCAELTASEDTDVLLYGSPMLRGFMTSQAHDNMFLVKPHIVQETMGLSESEFLDFAILCGTDFSDRIPKVGPSKAIELIKQYHTIEDIVNHLSQHKNKGGNCKFSVPESYLQEVAEARTVFTSLPGLEKPHTNLGNLKETWFSMSLDAYQAREDKVLEQCETTWKDLRGLSTEKYTFSIHNPFGENIFQDQPNHL